MQLNPEEINFRCPSDAGRWMNKEALGGKLAPVEIQKLQCPSDAGRIMNNDIHKVIPTHFGPHQEKENLRTHEVSWIIAQQVTNLSRTI